MAYFQGLEPLFRWLTRILLTLGACFFLMFGIHVLVASFYLTDPFMFIMSFFGSSLMVLISAAILAGLIARTIREMRSGKGK
jgi:membrane protein implicated in regulation of membrane protease activity